MMILEERNLLGERCVTLARDASYIDFHLLVFFGDAERITHVGLYLGEGQYIHSSGKDKGRNGIGIDTLYPSDDPVSRGYYGLLKGAGRVLKSYQPTGTPWERS